MAFVKILAPATTDAFYAALRTALLANGWTEHKVLAGSSATARSVVFKGTERTAGVGDAPFAHVLTIDGTSAIAGYLGFKAYTDFDATTEVGMNAAGAAPQTGTNGYLASYANGNVTNAFVVLDGLGFWVVEANTVGGSTTHKWVYVGLLDRQIPSSVGGVTKLSAGIAAGVSALPIALPITPYEGQLLQIVNRGGNSASANASHVEVVTVGAGSTSTSIVLSAPTTKAYDAGALVGENVWPCGVLNVYNAGAPPWFSYLCCDADGTRSDATYGELARVAFVSGEAQWKTGGAHGYEYTNAFRGRLNTGLLPVGTDSGSNLDDFVGVMPFARTVTRADGVPWTQWQRVRDAVTSEDWWVAPMAGNNGYGYIDGIALGPGADTGTGAGTFGGYIVADDVPSLATTPPAPTVTLVSPAPGNITPSSILVVEVTGSDLRFFSLVVRIGSEPGRIEELVYKTNAVPADGFGASFKGVDNLVEVITDGFRITFIRDGGWPSNGVAPVDLELDVDAVNGGTAE